MYWHLPVNLKDSAPFASLHDPDLTPDQLETWDQLYQEGCRQEAGGAFPEAVRRYQEAAKLDDHYADLEFRLGRCLSALRQPEQARQHLLRARDQDALRFRADTNINALLRAVAADREKEGVHLVDAERLFATASPDAIPGEDYFLEHVHMSFAGNYLLARCLFEKIAAVLPPAVKGEETKPPRPPSEQQCAERLAYTGWNRLKILTTIQMLLKQPPFLDQLDCAERERRWKTTAETLRESLKLDVMRQTVVTYQKAIEQAPNDWMLRMNFAQLVTEGGDPQAAVAQYQTILEQNPHLFSAHIKLGDLFSRARVFEKAIDHYRLAIAMNPDFAEPQHGLARALAASGKTEEALAIHQQRLRNEPDRSGALEQLAEFLLGIGRPEEAKQRLTEALQIDPDNAAAHAHLGVVLAQQGALAAATKHYEEALRLRPGWPDVETLLAALKTTKAQDGANNKK